MQATTNCFNEMTQTLIRILLTGCLCVCAITTSTSNSPTKSTPSTQSTFASFSSSLTTSSVSGSGTTIIGGTTKSLTGSLTTTPKSPSATTTKTTSGASTSYVLTPTIINTPTTNQLSTNITEITTVKVSPTSLLNESSLTTTILWENSTITSTGLTNTAMNTFTTTVNTAAKNTFTTTANTAAINTFTTTANTTTLNTFSTTANTTTMHTFSTTANTSSMNTLTTTAYPTAMNTFTTTANPLPGKSTTPRATSSNITSTIAIPNIVTSTSSNNTKQYRTPSPIPIATTTEATTIDSETNTSLTTNTETTVSTMIHSETTTSPTTNTETTTNTNTNPETTTVQTAYNETTESNTTNTDTTNGTTTHAETTATTAATTETTASSTIYTESTTPDKHPATTAQPVNTTTSSVQPVNTTTSSVQPVNTTASSVQQVNTTTSSVQPVNTTTSSVQPVHTTTSSVQPVNTTTSSVQPENTTTYSVQPVNTTTSSVQPENTTTSSVQPLNTTTSSVKPVITTTSSVQPVNTTTSSVPSSESPTSSVSPSVTPTSMEPSSTKATLECLNITEPVNGNVKISSDGKVATYTCHDGYRLIGSVTRTCTNGTWSGYEPSCLKNCQKPDTPANGYVSLSASNTTATFTCIPGFFLNGSNQLTCGDGNWSNEVPSCHIQDCGKLTDPENGRVNQSGTLYASVVNYICNEGFNIIGTLTRTCLESGRWSGQTPSCSRVSTCKCKDDTDIWGVVWYESLCGQTKWLQCPRGNSGNYTRQCDSKGVWVKLNNTCVREAITNISNTLNSLSGTNVTALAIANVLNTMTEASPVHANATPSEKLSGGEVSKLADSLAKVADILKSSFGTVILTSNMTQDFLTSTSNLLGKKDTWKTMKESGTNDGGTILKAVDTLTDVLRTSFQSDSTININFKTTNIAIKLVHITGDKAINFPGDDLAGELNWDGRNTKTGITFHPSSFNTTFATGVLYRNMTDILPTHSSNDSIYPEIRGQVVAFSVCDTSVNLTKNITIQIEHFSPSFTNPQCSFWNKNSSGTGQWSTQGCFFVNSTANLTTCECNHLTNFAVLMSPFVEVDDNPPLRLISIIGISVSMFGLLLTMVLHACLWRRVKNERSSLRINLCVALFCAYILFLSGVDRTESKAFCAAVAALLHYIYLVVFCLMLAEGIEIVITVVYVFATKSRARPMIILAWAIPAVIVGVSLGVTKTKGYGNEKFCWLSLKDGVIWAFVGPALFIIVLNVGSLVIVLWKLFTMKAMENKTIKDKILTSVRSLCVLVPLMGVSWILGIFYVNEDLAVMQYVFAVCNSLQGFCIFLIHCVFNQKMRAALCMRYRRHKFETDTKDSRQKRSHATTNGTSDWRNLILETSSSETINPPTEIRKIRRPSVNYKPGSSEDNGYHDNNAAGYTSLAMRSAGYTANMGYNRQDTHVSDNSRDGYGDFRNYASTEL